MPLTPLTSASSRFYLRRQAGEGATVSGPFGATEIAAMLADGRVDSGAEISTDRRVWASVRTLASGGGDGGDDSDGILLAPLELGGSADRAALPEGPNMADAESDGIEMGAALELEERQNRKPPPHGSSAAPGPQQQAEAGSSAAGTDSLPSHRGAALIPGRNPTGVPGKAAAQSAASATVASLLETEVQPGEAEAQQPLRLDEILTAPAEVKPLARPRTRTAALGGQPGQAVASPRWRPSRRLKLVAGGIILLGGTGVLVVVADLPDRLRGEPASEGVLGSVAADIALDRFPAFSEGARLLEEAAGARRHTPATRAAAAELLASSVVIHGGERGRVAHAEALLEIKAEPGEPARSARARALAWVALAKSRWKDAERIVSETPTLAAADSAVLRGWAALGRDDAAGAAQLFQAAVQAGEPAPKPSRVAALYALAKAREADLSPTAEAAFRAVLAAAPAHVGAALGMARSAKLSPAGRLKLAEAVLAKQARDASRIELADAHVLASRAARELGAVEKAEAAFKRAREVDPSGIAVAVLSGDLLLAEGRTDEAVGLYKLTLAAPLGAARTPSLRLARLAAAIESARKAEATASLLELERKLPGDARVAFWQGRAAERAQPADLAAADKAYREALMRDPRFLPASLQLARLLLDQRRGPDALAVLRRAEKEGAGAVTLRTALGQALLAAGNPAEAARTFRQAIAAIPRNAPPAAAVTTRLGLAAALEGQGNLEAARVELAQLEGSTAGQVPGLGARLAVVLGKLGRRDEALTAYRKEIAAGQASGATKVAAARLALELRQLEVARTLAQATVDEDPRTPGALLVLAEIRRAAGDPNRALADLRRALAVVGSPAVQLEYGRALAALGRDEDALSALSQARDLPEAGVERGRILLRRGDAETASKELSAVTARLPGHAEAFLLLGQAEDRLGRAPRAETAWRTAVKLAPTLPEARYRLGRLEMDRGHAAAALPQLRAAADHLRGGEAPAASWRPDLYFQLGFAELRQGSRERALTAFRRYLEIAPADAPARAEVTRQVADLNGASR